MNKIKPIRFDLLDGFRGVAALAVMIYHFSQQSGLNWLGGAWVSVDLFFILSGFVIAYNYAQKIIDGMGFYEFLKIRLIRLGPLYIFGLLLGFIAYIFSEKFDNENSFSTSFVLLMYGLLWIPTLDQGAIFPLNNPAWSLFFELFINLAFFIYVKNKKSLPNRVFVIFAFIFYLSISLIFRKINPGWSAENFIFGFPRVFSGFLIGIYIYSSNLHEKKWNNSKIVLLMIAPIILFLVENHEIAFFNSIFFVPIAIVIAASTRCTEIIRKLCKILGDLSYPIYVIHFPIFLILINIGFFRNFNSIQQLLLASGMCICISMIILKIDFEIRKKLSNKYI